jgi:hypothetical protein
VNLASPDTGLSREPYLNAMRAAEHLSISPKKLLALARAGFVPAHGIGTGRRKMWRFLLSELDHWMQTEVSLPGRNHGKIGGSDSRFSSRFSGELSAHFGRKNAGKHGTMPAGSPR